MFLSMHHQPKPIPTKYYLPGNTSSDSELHLFPFNYFIGCKNVVK